MRLRREWAREGNDVGGRLQLAELDVSTSTVLNPAHRNAMARMPRAASRRTVDAVTTSFGNHADGLAAARSLDGPLIEADV